MKGGHKGVNGVSPSKGQWGVEDVMGGSGYPGGNRHTDNNGRNQNSGEGQKARRAVFQLVSIGIQLVASTFGGLALGYYIDKYLDTRPWFTIILLILGISAGFINIYTTAKKYDGSS